VFPVKYELDFYIPEDAILHSHRRGHLKSYTLYLPYDIRSTRLIHMQPTILPATCARIAHTSEEELPFYLYANSYTVIWNISVFLFHSGIFLYRFVHHAFNLKQIYTVQS
jgi:hypothetical protein